MNQCDNTLLYSSIEACPGKRILPGIRRRIYYQSKQNIVSYPKLYEVGDADVTMAKLGQLKGNFVLKAEKYWQFLDLKDESSNVTFETVGEAGSKLFTNHVNAIIVGMEDEVKGLARQAVNDDMVFVYQERDGSFCVIGNDNYTTHVVPSGDTSAESTASTSSTFAIDCNDECPVPTYVGTLALSEKSVLDCSTGEIETDSSAT